MTIPCPICRLADLRVVTVPRETGARDGTHLTYPEELLQCPACGERFFNHAQELASRRSRAAAQRAHEHLLTPAEIRDIRGRFGLSQADLEALLGVGAKTVVRWERGSVRQSRAADTLLRFLAYFGPAAFDCVADPGTGGPADQRTDQRTSAPADQRTSGPTDQRTSAPADVPPPPPLAHKKPRPRRPARRKPRARKK